MPGEARRAEGGKGGEGWKEKERIWEPGRRDDKDRTPALDRALNVPLKVKRSLVASERANGRREQERTAAGRTIRGQLWGLLCLCPVQCELRPIEPFTAFFVLCPLRVLPLPRRVCHARTANSKPHLISKTYLTVTQ